MAKDPRITGIMVVLSQGLVHLETTLRNNHWTLSKKGGLDVFLAGGLGSPPPKKKPLKSHDSQGTVCFPERMSPKKGSISKGQVLFQPLIVRGYASFHGSEWGAAPSPDSIDHKDCPILSRRSYHKPLLATGKGPHPKHKEPANNILYMMMMCTCNQQLVGLFIILFFNQCQSDLHVQSEYNSSGIFYLVVAHWSG